MKNIRKTIPVEMIEKAARVFFDDGAISSAELEDAVTGWLADEEMSAALVRSLAAVRDELVAEKDAEIERLKALVLHDNQRWAQAERERDDARTELEVTRTQLASTIDRLNVQESLVERLRTSQG